MIDDDMITLLRDKTTLGRFNIEEVRAVFNVLDAEGYELRKLIEPVREDTSPAGAIETAEPESEPVAVLPAASEVQPIEVAPAPVATAATEPEKTADEAPKQ